jgi:hypothetical protein
MADDRRREDKEKCQHRLRRRRRGHRQLVLLGSVSIRSVG